MPEQTLDTQPAPPTSNRPRKIHRVRIGMNVVVQVVILCALAIMVNYLGFEHYRRWDFSRDKKFTLSDKTKRFLRNLPGKARITVFFLPNSIIYGDLQGMLTEFQYAGKGKIDVETIDPTNPTQAKVIFEKYKVITNEEALILDYEGRTKTVKASEMAEVDQGNQMMGESPKVTAFKGEQAVTSALMELVEGKKNKIGYVLGHKEIPIADPPPKPPTLEDPGEKTSALNILRTFIENENIGFQDLSLFDVGAIPTDLNGILINGPQYDFTDREMKLLRDYWEKQGRILLLLDPSAKTPKLNAFLNDLGVQINDDRLFALARTGIEEVGLLRDVQGRFLPDSPITKRLAEARGIFPGGTASITLDEDKARPFKIRLNPLIQAEKGYWAETDYTAEDQTHFQASMVRNGDTIHTFAVSIEKGGSADERVQANSSRMVVVTNSTFIQNIAIREGQQALDFMSGSINWLLNREQLIGIAPKVPQTLIFTLDDRALRNLRWLILLVMPLTPAIIGWLVWWQRRV